MEIATPILAGSMPKGDFAFLIGVLLFWVTWCFFRVLFKIFGDKNDSDPRRQHHGSVKCIPVNCIPCGTTHCTCLPECPLCESEERNELVRELSSV